MHLTRLKERYEVLTHALQSGVAQGQVVAPKECEPKHLRLGINMALVETAALGRLLIEGDFITEEEYYTALVDQLEREVRRYEKTLSKQMGVEVKLI